MKNFRKFPSIENFVGLHHEVKKNIFVNDRPVINYRGKIKLHGTNAGVNMHKTVAGDKAANYAGELSITPQKRTSYISPLDDNAGFAKWVQVNYKFFTNVFDRLDSPDADVTVFGEWAGKGIQKSDAVSKIEEKNFFIFAIRVDDKWITDPRDLFFYTGISGIVNDRQINVLPWSTEELKVDFSSSIDVQKFVDHVNVLTEPLNQIDPYIKERFGIEDHGEGFVFYPIIDSTPYMTDKQFDFVFKAKVEAHSMSGNKNKSAEVDPILHDNAAKFAADFVTDARLKQALSEVYPGRDMSDATRKDTGPILAWVCRDVLKESVATLEASGMDWKQVSKAVASRTSHMYFKLLESMCYTIS